VQIKQISADVTNLVFSGLQVKESIQGLMMNGHTLLLVNGKEEHALTIGIGKMFAYVGGKALH